MKDQRIRLDHDTGHVFVTDPEGVEHHVGTIEPHVIGVVEYLPGGAVGARLDLYLPDQYEDPRHRVQREG